MSLLSTSVKKRRDGVYGLNVFSAIVPSCLLHSKIALQILRVLDHLFARRQLYVSLLPVPPVTFCTPAPPEFSVECRGSYCCYLHFENQLHRFFDFGFRRVGRNFENHGVLRLLHRETLLGDDGTLDHCVCARGHRLSLLAFGLGRGFVLGFRFRLGFCCLCRPRGLFRLRFCLMFNFVLCFVLRSRRAFDLYWLGFSRVFFDRQGTAHTL